jgi:hypothetical protein
VSGAQALAEEEIASFLGIDSEVVSELVDMEFTVNTPKIPDDGPEPNYRFEVEVFASVKRNSVRQL